jgi:hypothetical protein
MVRGVPIINRSERVARIFDTPNQIDLPQYLALAVGLSHQTRRSDLWIVFL